MDIVKSKTMMLRSLNLCYTWFVVSMSFYALSLNSHSLAGTYNYLIPFFTSDFADGNPLFKGDRFLNFFFVSLVEIPGYTMSFIGMEKLGRRFSTSSSMLLGGVFCMVGAFKTWNWLELASFLLGKMCITSAFATIFLLTSELYPTSIRPLGNFT